MIAVAVYLAATPSPGAGATVGNWSRTCMAPNWKYGGMESVWDQNINSPVQAWSFFQKIPGGHWRIFYNLAQINPQYATPDFFRFLFYVECAHVKLNNSDEHLADCQALADMKADIGISPQALNEISAAYASRGRLFPSGGACPSRP
jgi:hypothetical protein